VLPGARARVGPLAGYSSEMGKLRENQRVQLGLSPDAYKYLAQTRALTGARTTGEVVRRGFRVHG
jgi:hypothetical protein